MIQFRCWYCDRYWRKPPEHVHETFDCRCGHTIRVPKRDWRSSKPWSFTNWLIGAVVYGGAMGLFTFGFAFFFLGRNPMVLTTLAGWAVLGGLSLLGVVVGVLGGERGVAGIVGFFERHGSTIMRSGSPGG